MAQVNYGVDEELEWALDELVDQYQVDLDTALVTREQTLETSQMDMMAAMTQRDFAQMVVLARKTSRVRTAVHDVNERYAEMFAGTMDDDLAAAFTTQYRHEAFPRIYRPQGTQRAFDMVLGWDELEPDTRDSIGALQEAYLLELETMNDRLRSTTLQHEPDASIHR